MYTKILILTLVSVFPFLSLGTCPPDTEGLNYDYINPEVDTQWSVDQVFLVKDTGLITVDSFPSFCSDIDDTVKGEKLTPDQIFMIVGEFMTFINWNNSDTDMPSEGYFKVSLVTDGIIDMTNTRWIDMNSFYEMKAKGKIEKITGKMIFQPTEKSLSFK